MPYIIQERRKKRFDYDILNLYKLIENEGDLNYCITKLCHLLVFRKWMLSYKTLNKIMGILKCVSSEFYRKVAAPYEDIKESENGPIL